MRCMARKKTKTDDKKPNRTHTAGIQFFTTPELVEALDEYVNSKPADDRPTKRGILETALMDYLTKRGAWPKKGKTPPDPK